MPAVPFTIDEIQNQGTKILVYGGAGVGKTALIATLPGGDDDTLIISAEKGQLTLAPKNQMRMFNRVRRMYGMTVNNEQDILEVIAQLKADTANQIKNVAIDSLTDIADRILAYELSVNKDGRKAYGNMSQAMFRLMRDFLDLTGKNVYFIAHTEKISDNGMLIYGPSFPGQTTSEKMPHFPDEVFALYMTPKDAQGVSHRVLRTRPDHQFSAKDRSGALAELEYPDLASIITKIKNQ